MYHTSNEPDSSLIRLIGLYWQYFVALRARAKEGRPYLLRALYAILENQRLPVKKIGPGDGQPFDPTTGRGYLFVAGYLLDVTVVEQITPELVYEARAKTSGVPGRYYLFNFGSDFPDWYPRPQAWQPFSEEEWNCWLEEENNDENESDDEDDADDLEA